MYQHDVAKAQKKHGGRNELTNSILICHDFHDW